MAFEYGARLNTGDYFSTTVDVENQTAETKGTIDGEPVDFGGGGGSSDFSTAEVTLNLTPPSGVSFVKEFVSAGISFPDEFFDNDGKGYYLASIMAVNHKATILMYNGVGYIEFASANDAEDNSYLALSPSVTGDISWDENVGDCGAFVVTGDGTITASEWD